MQFISLEHYYGFNVERTFKMYASAFGNIETSSRHFQRRGLATPSRASRAYELPNTSHLDI